MNSIKFKFLNQKLILKKIKVKKTVIESEILIKFFLVIHISFYSNIIKNLTIFKIYHLG